MTTRSSRRRHPAPRAGRTNQHSQTARPERPAWRDPGRMLGSMLSNAGSAMFVAALVFLLQHVEVTWR
ncbi:hypothetical protein ACFVVA_41405 [Kitasatospora sp. NPDC058048]|uniref:hypothetical protein n=1 Tax=Kitasatospora sp. NPDC058048 TaxID=3346313 RepID=UPI0036DF508F